MADGSTSESWKDKLAKAFPTFAVIVGIIWAVPQDKVVKETLPGVWEAIKALWPLIKIQSIKAWAIVQHWISKYWPAFRKFVFRWMGFSFALMCVGILFAQHGYPFGGQVVGVIGAMCLQGLCIGLMLGSSALGTVIAVKLALLESFLPGDPEPDDLLQKAQAKFDEARKAWAARISAGAVLVCALLIPFEMFTSWASLGVTIVMMGLGLAAVFAVIHEGGEFGAVIGIIKWISLGLVLLILVAFVVFRAPPSLLFTSMQAHSGAWLRSINKTEWIVSFTALGLLVMLCIGLFGKVKDQRSSWIKGTVVLALLSVLLIAFLTYRGTTSYKQLTNHDAPDIGEQVDILHDALAGLKGRGKKETGIKTAGGTYVPVDAVHMAPPSRDLVTSTPMRTPSTKTAPTHAAQTRDLPTEPPPKKYHDDPGALIKDLRAEGY